MTKELVNLVERLSDPVLDDSLVIPWSSPVPSFGDIENSIIATLGLNPSNLEFVDEKGNELEGPYRRFHTLNSLGLNNWAEIRDEHLELIIYSCKSYFYGNPYDKWFKKLDFILGSTSYSYYFPSLRACHLDLIPFATSSKWSKLSSKQRTALLNSMGDTLGILLNASKIKVLVLNGSTVVENLQRISGIELEKTHMVDWTLPRKNGNGISGFAFKGIINNVGSIPLNKEVMVLGYNHNIQSSFGVTKDVMKSIQEWVGSSVKEIFDDSE